MSNTYFTDEEYRLVLSSLSRERKVCEMVDKDCDEERKLLKLMSSIERKIKRVQYHENEHKEWISVDDALPEENIKVLAWYEYFRYGEYNCMFQTYGIGYVYGDMWLGDVSGTRARCISWQPLPEPYKEDNKD